MITKGMQLGNLSQILKNEKRIAEFACKVKAMIGNDSNQLLRYTAENMGMFEFRVRQVENKDIRFF